MDGSDGQPSIGSAVASTGPAAGSGAVVAAAAGAAVAAAAAARLASSHTGRASQPGGKAKVGPKLNVTAAALKSDAAG